MIGLCFSNRSLITDSCITNFKRRKIIALKNYFTITIIIVIIIVKILNNNRNVYAIKKKFYYKFFENFIAVNLYIVYICSEKKKINETHK